MHRSSGGLACDALSHLISASSGRNSSGVPPCGAVRPEPRRDDRSLDACLRQTHRRTHQLHLQRRLTAADAPAELSHRAAEPRNQAN
jgi:hypothetical protein